MSQIILKNLPLRLGMHVSFILTRRRLSRPACATSDWLSWDLCTFISLIIFIFLLNYRVWEMTASLLQRSFFAIRYPSVERDLASEGPKNDSFRVGCSLEIAFSDRIMAPWRNERRGPLSLSRFGCSFKRIIASRAGASILGKNLRPQTDFD